MSTLSFLPVSLRFPFSTVQASIDTPLTLDLNLDFNISKSNESLPYLNMEMFHSNELLPELPMKFLVMEEVDFNLLLLSKIHSPESTMEKILRAILHEKIYPQGSCSTMFIKKYLETSLMPKIDYDGRTYNCCRQWK